MEDATSTARYARKTQCAGCVQPQRPRQGTCGLGDSQVSLEWQFHSVSVSEALLFAVFGSVTPLGAVTVAVSEIEPVAEALIVPVAL